EKPDDVLRTGFAGVVLIRAIREHDHRTDALGPRSAAFTDPPDRLLDQIPEAHAPPRREFPDRIRGHVLVTERKRRLGLTGHETDLVTVQERVGETGIGIGLHLLERVVRRLEVEREHHVRELAVLFPSVLNLGEEPSARWLFGLAIRGSEEERSEDVP